MGKSTVRSPIRVLAVDGGWVGGVLPARLLDLAAVTDAMNRTTSFAYDAAGRRTGVTDSLNRTTATVYDAAGNAVASVDPLGERTTFAYDALGRVTGVTDALRRGFKTSGWVLRLGFPIRSRRCPR